MTIYFLTKQKEICDCICEALKKEGHLCSTFTESTAFYASVKSRGAAAIDLLAIDYRLFQHDFFDPYEKMISQKCIIPLIYYNDPYPEPENRAVFWKVQNHEHLGAYLPESRLEDLFPVLKEMQTLMNAPDLNPYISVINKPLPFQPADSRRSTPQNFDCIAFKMRHKIPQSRFKLFSYLYENCGRSLTIKNICTHLWEEYTSQKIKTLYTYIHDLRKFCREEPSVRIDIIHDGKEKYYLSISADDNVNESYSPIRTATDYFKRIPKNKIEFKTVSSEYLEKYKKHPGL
jgi:DNA-binding response OmpR family regulator